MMILMATRYIMYVIVAVGINSDGFGGLLTKQRQVFGVLAYRLRQSGTAQVLVQT